MTLELDNATVFVVDDDEGVCQSLRWLFESVSLRTETFTNAKSFLEAYEEERSGCLVLDIRMPGMSGLALQELLQQRGITLPVVIITGHGDIPMAVRAMKIGAIDFIQKPYNPQQLLETVQQAINTDLERRRQQANHEDLAARFEQLSPRERQVAELVCRGLPNRRISEELEVSPKTIEVHRARVMEKMRAATLADLVQMMLALRQAS